MCGEQRPVSRPSFFCLLVLLGAWLAGGAATAAPAAVTRTDLSFASEERRRPAAGPVAAWLTAAHPMRETGALFSTEADMTEPAVITDRFDAVLFVDRTTRARPNPRPETGTTRKPAAETGGGGNSGSD